MKSNIVLILCVTTTLLACGKTEEMVEPTPVMDAPLLAEPAPAAAEPAALEPTMPEPVAAEPAPATPAAAPAVTVSNPQPKAPVAPSVPAKPAQPVAPKPAASVAPTAPITAPIAETAPAAPKPDLARGQQVHRQSCAVCHDKGVAGAPKTGDAATWAPRLARGMEAMYNTALNGKGAMPAKGGNPALSETDVKAAVDYLAAQSR